MNNNDMLQVQRFTFNQLAEHTYVIYDDAKDCMIVDPGCSTREEEQELSAFIVEKSLCVTQLINTHCHVDHIVGNAYVKRTYNVPLAIHPEEVFMLELSPSHASHYGISYCEPTQAELFLRAGDRIQLGNSHLQVLHVPGHSKGHIALYSPVDQLCLAGDVLFKNYVGRTDLPGGDYEVLMRSIHEQLFLLDDLVVIYPGHGAKTTIGIEKKNNPYCKVAQ
jgi:hydroxyacylglutathione hydrolase